MDWAAAPHLLKQAGLVVNATSMGMAGNPGLPADLAGARDSAAIGEMAYAPLKTKLLQDAEKRA
ncbi:MAG: hypothetical protein ACT4N4_18335 [Rhodospirillales bacterium]